MRLKNKIMSHVSTSFLKDRTKTGSRIRYIFGGSILLSFLVAVCFIHGTVHVIAKREAFGLFTSQDIAKIHIEENIDIANLSTDFYNSIPSEFEVLTIRHVESKRPGIVYEGEYPYDGSPPKLNSLDKVAEKISYWTAAPNEKLISLRSRVDGEKNYTSLYKQDGKLLISLTSTVKDDNGLEVIVIESILDVGKSMVSSIKVILLFLLVMFITQVFLLYIFHNYIYISFIKPIQKINHDLVDVRKGREERLEFSNIKDESISSLVDKINLLIGDAIKARLTFKTFSEEAAHEIKNPLNNIINTAELQKDMDETCAESMDVIIHQAYTINSLLDGLTDLSTLHLLKDRIKDLDTVMCPIENLEEILGYFEETHPDKEFVLEIQEGFDLHVIMEPTLFRLVVQNVIGNAVKFTDEGTPIIIRLSRSAPHKIEITVENKGPTISLEEQEKIFEKYYRTKHSKKQVSGSGLGLWIVKEVLNAYHGKIFARSTKDSTIVTILLKSCKEC